MRTLLLLALSLALAALAGCGRLGHADADLDRAASLMQTRPDSALCIVRGVDGDMPRKALYEAWALCKCYRVDEMDSALSKAADYYKAGHGSPSDRMIFHYLSGMSEATAHNYGSAVENLLKAEELGKTLHDNLYLGLIYRYLADTFDDLYNQHNALHYSKASYRSFSEYGDSSYIDYAMCDLAASYGSSFRNDSALIYANRALERAEITGDSVLASSALSVIASCYIGLDDYQRAYDSLREMKNEYGFAHEKDISNLGFVCLHLNRPEEAKHYLQKINDVKLKNSLAFRIAEAEGDYENAYGSLLGVYFSNDSILLAVMNETANLQIATYYNKRDNELKTIMSEERTRHRALMIIVAIIIVLGAIILMQRRVIHKKEINEKMQLVQSLTDTVASYKQSIQEKDEAGRNKEFALKNEISKIFAERFSLLDQLCSDYYESHGTSGEKAKIYNRVRGLINRFRSDSDTIEQLCSAVNRYRSNTLHWFENDFPTISKEETLLFLYLTLGLSSRTISVLFDIRIEAVYNRKSKLKKKIEQSESPHKDLYLDLF